MAGTSVDWNAIGAVATAVATLVALGFGLRDSWRRRAEAARRGRVALAMQLPEIARLVALFDRVESHYQGMLDRTQDVWEHAGQLAKLAPQFKTPLSRRQVRDFIDMPESLGYNLPTVIHSLPVVAIYAKGAIEKLRETLVIDTPNLYAPQSAQEDHKRKINQNIDLFLAHVAEAFSYTRSCSVDFRAAMAYANDHLLPLQMRNMEERLPKDTESSAES